MARPSGRDIRQMAIDEARVAVQTHGVNGFSYGDLAKRIGVKAPSLHHHFRHKHDLIADTASAYRDRFQERVAAIDADDTIDRLRAYGELFLSPADDGLLCFCGAAAAGWGDLSESVQALISSFFDEQVAWVVNELVVGQRRDEIDPTLEASEVALAYVGALEGALLLARTRPGASDATQVISVFAGLFAPPDAAANRS